MPNVMKPMNYSYPSTPHAQRGAATLLIALVLLLGGTLITFFANRGLIFEQRTSANQYRATSAFEFAEAGIEWGIGKLNERLPLGAAPSCATGGVATAPSFLDRYVDPRPATATQPPSFSVPTDGRYAECRFDAQSVATNGGWTCSCPSAGGLIALGQTQQGRFGVRFNPTADSSAVELVARGCSNGASCDPDVVPADADATAVVRVLVKLRPSVPNGPSAALTAGTVATTGGSLNVVNQHAPSNGITIHAGGNVIAGSGTNTFTLPGTPPRNSILDNDATLANLTNASEEAFFAKFFGQTLTDFQQSGHSIRIDMGSAQANGTEIMRIVNMGGEGLRFFVPGDVSFSNGNVGSGQTIGTFEKPIVIVARGDMEIRGNVSAYGLLYSATATAVASEDPGGGGATVFGAYITRGAYTKIGNGNFSIIYDPTLWGAGRPNGQLVKVPGSWRDFPA
jgi:hypothetical protein